MKCPTEIAQEVSAWRMEKNHGDDEQRKKNDGAKGCGKDAGRKSQKADFPTPLGNPANPAGFPLIPQPRRLREIN
jgi:hypothetical protein